MKTKQLDEPLTLTLYNFDTCAAEDSPYVLTSPRSLEACRKAGCKPVELLYKSVEEYREDLGVDTAEQVYQLYAEQERDRLNKLERCRAIRQGLVKQVSHKENAPPYLALDSRHGSADSSSRKEQLDRENTSRATDKQTCKSIALKAVGISANWENRNPSLGSDISGSSCLPQRKVLCLTARETTPTSTTDSSTKKQSTTRTKRSSNKKSARKSFPSPSLVSSLRVSSASSDSSALSSSSSTIRTCRGTPLGLRARAERLSRPSSSICSKQGRLEQGKKLHLRDFGIATNYDSNNNSSSRNSVVSPKRKQVTFSYTSPDDLCLSEHDRRILEAMALKKEVERESEHFAHRAHLLWEHDRELRQQLTAEQAARWKDYVMEKRRLENLENTRKWEEMKSSLRKSQLQLEQRIRDKEERALLLRRRAEQRKLNEVGERSQGAAKRRAEVEAANQQMDLEVALWQQALDQQQKLKMQRAECTRNHHRETYRRRVASANRVEELRHQERWQQLRERTEAALQDLRHLCRLREQRAHEKHSRQLEHRNRVIKEQSLERELKSQQVRLLHEDLDRGLSRWQEQVTAMQWETTQRAGLKANLCVESKRQRVEMENRARQEHHSLLMQRIWREDEAKTHYIREMILRKEAKMMRMAQERDLAIRESRLQAQTTADLREHLRRTLSPETFDRKVARVALEMRVAGRPPTASPTMSRSHIILG